MGIYTITKGLSQNGCSIDLVAINTPKHSQPKDAMKSWARQYDVFVDTNIRVFDLLKNIFSEKTPYNIRRFQSTAVEKQLEELLVSNAYDFIQVEGAFVASYIPVIRKLSKAPVIVRTHNIEYVIWQRLATNERNPLKKWFFNHLAKRLYRFEAEYYNMADGIAAITPDDEDRLRRMKVTIPVSVIPVGTEMEKFNVPPIASEVNSLFIIGALDWMPNLEGLQWFMDNIWPKVYEQEPNVLLHIAGKGTPEHITNWNIPNVKVHGFVDDAIHFMNSYRIMLVPLLSGGGMRVKIIEGLAAGKCIISTSVGAEGIPVQHGENILLADTPEEWIKTILHLLSEPEEIERIGKNARELALASFENKSVTAAYVRFAKELTCQS
jgi:polysaccharide biosynthesis protein PslH